MLHTNKSAHVYRTREMNILAYSITVEGTRAKQKPSSRSVTPAKTTSDGLPTWIPREAQKPTRVHLSNRIQALCSASFSASKRWGEQRYFWLRAQEHSKKAPLARSDQGLRAQPEVPQARRTHWENAPRARRYAELYVAKGTWTPTKTNRRPFWRPFTYCSPSPSPPDSLRARFR